MKQDALAVVTPALGGAKADVRIIADCRYVGQGHEIRVAVPLRTLTNNDGARLKAEFEKTYEQVYGLRIPNQDLFALKCGPYTFSCDGRKSICFHKIQLPFFCL